MAVDVVELSVNDLTSKLENCLHEYESWFFVFNVRTLVLSLQVKWMNVILNIFECWKQKHEVPDRISVLLKDLIAFKRRIVHMNYCNVNKETRKALGYTSILYHNKGIDMVNLPKILNTKCVRDAVPSCVQNAWPPIVSFKYTKTVAGSCWYK